MSTILVPQSQHPKIYVCNDSSHTRLPKQRMKCSPRVAVGVFFRPLALPSKPALPGPVVLAAYSLGGQMLGITRTVFYMFAVVLVGAELVAFSRRVRASFDEDA
jgi:hypothetical protein